MRELRERCVCACVCAWLIRLAHLAGDLILPIVVMRDRRAFTIELKTAQPTRGCNRSSRVCRHSSWNGLNQHEEGHARNTRERLDKSPPHAARAYSLDPPLKVPSTKARFQARFAVAECRL